MAEPTAAVAAEVPSDAVQQTADSANSAVDKNPATADPVGGGAQQEPVATSHQATTDEEAGCGATASTWLNVGSWLSYAKQQSSSVYQNTRSQSAHVWGFVKKDLGEFASTIKSDTKAVYEQVRGSSGEHGVSSSKSSDRLKSGLNSLASAVANAMYIPPDDSDEQALLVTRTGEVCPHDWEQSRIAQLRADPATFLGDPQGQPEAFLSFLEEFDADTEAQEISGLLMASTELRSLYSQLVPAELTHKHFWARYYFRVRCVLATARQREELKRRGAAATAAAAVGGARPSASASASAPIDDLDAISWDDDDDEDAEPTPQQAAAAPPSDADNAAASELKLSERGDTVVVRHPASASEDSSAASSSASSGQPAAAATTAAEVPPASQPPPPPTAAPGEASATAQAEVGEDEDEEEEEIDDDVELTEEDLRKARELATGAGKIGEDDEEEEDDWGKWE